MSANNFSTADPVDIFHLTWTTHDVYHSSWSIMWLVLCKHQAVYAGLHGWLVSAVFKDSFKVRLCVHLRSQSVCPSSIISTCLTSSDLWYVVSLWWICYYLHSIPFNIRQSQTLPTFKRHLKTQYFQSAFLAHRNLTRHPESFRLWWTSAYLLTYVLASLCYRQSRWMYSP